MSLLKKLEINGFNINYGYMFVRGKGLPTSKMATKSVKRGDVVINGMIGISAFLFLIMKFLKNRFFWKIFCC